MKRKSEGEYVATVPDLREFNAGKYAFETFIGFIDAKDIPKQRKARAYR